jgi:hypothetical protein
MNGSHSSPFDQLLQRVRVEFGEVPNLRLTPSQAQLLLGLDPSACAAVLDALLEEGFLSRTQQGLFVRSPTTRS